MKIVFLAPSLAAGSGGVADYTLRLAEALAEEGVTAALAGFAEDAPFSDSGLRLSVPASWGGRERDAACRAFIGRFAPDWISLQFVPYAFGARGVAWGLGERLRRLAGGVPWHVMFHEIWIGAKKEAPFRQRLLGRVQRASLVRNMRALRPRLAHTSNATYRALLGDAGIGAGILPLFGNIPIAPPSEADAEMRARLASHGVDLDGPGRERLFLAGFFGALHPIWPPEPLFSHLVRAQEASGRRTVLVSVGRLGPGRDLWARLAREYGDRFAFVALGEQPPEAVSRLLQGLDCGIATTPWQVIGKSGSAAAMAEHGLPVIVNRTERYGPPADGAADDPDPLFLPMGDDLAVRLLSLPGRRPPRSRLPEVARRLRIELETARGGVQSGA